MGVHIYITEVPLENTLDRILTTLNQLVKEEKKMDADIQAIIDQATKNEDAEQAATAALNGLSQAFLNAINQVQSITPADRATIQAKVAEMQNSAAAIGAAIVADTPSAPSGS